MPRMGRIVLPNYPHHVVQRGHNRQVVFAAEQDYQRYISDLRELKDVLGKGDMGKGDRFIFEAVLGLNK